MATSGSITTLDVTLRQLRDDVVVIALAGDLDSFSVAMLRNSLDGLVAGTHTVFDLSAVPFIDSAGLGALIAGVRRVRERGDTATVVSARGNIVRLLHVTGFDRIAVVHPTLEAALLRP